MKKFAKIIALAAVVVLMLSCFVGCNKGGDKYVIATDTTFAPFEFTDAQGNFVGIDVELLAAIAEDQGFEYELQPLGFNAAVTALETGQADGVIAGMSITEERKQKYTFSEPYYDSGVVMAIAADNNEIKSYEDLKGKTVAVKSGTEGQTFANSIKDKYGFTVSVLEGSGMMYEAVKSGTADACFEDYPVMGYGISQGNGLKMVTDMEQGSSYGFAVLTGSGNEDLAKMFNDGLKNIKENGKYDEIINKYIATK